MKRDSHASLETRLSPRRSKRIRSSGGDELNKLTPASIPSQALKPIKPISANGKQKRGSVKVESDTDEGDVLSSEVKGKKRNLAIATVEESQKKTKPEIEIQTNKAKIPVQVTKQEKSKVKKEAEMVPLAARTKGLQMFVGAHVSAAKGWYSLPEYLKQVKILKYRAGVQNSILNSVHIGGNSFALFLKSQRKWDNPPLQDEHREQFLKYCVEYDYDASKYILPHGSYLVNLAQEEEAKAKQAYNSFLDDLRRCEQLGIRLYNFHPGAAGQSTVEAAITRLARSLTKALEATKTVTPVLETMCGHGTTLGGDLSELGAVISQIPEKYHSRIGVCIDTCHSFSYGYDLVSPKGFKAFMQEFDEKIGLGFLKALHLNDSKAPRGSKRDLHANIGTGFMGLRAFHNVMNEERFQGLPMILETPIDRPGPTSQVKNKEKATKHPKEDGEDHAEQCGSDHESDSPPSKKTKKSVSPKNKLIEDKGVWAREIKLLESLIGMDPEGSEFRALEARLSEEGRSERQKHQEQYDRKLETEAKKKRKEIEKGQKSLDSMLKKKDLS